MTNLIGPAALVWQELDAKKPLAARIAAGMATYQERVQRPATLVQVNPAEAAAVAALNIAGLEVVGLQRIIANTYWFGQVQQEQA